MKSTFPTSSPVRSTCKRAFTLVELMVGMSIGLLIMGAVCMIIVMSARTVTKITMLDDATSNTRKIQEHINKELSAAISQTNPIRIVPVYGDVGASGRAGSITYRTQIGSFATVPSATTSSSSSITLDCPADVNIVTGDFVMIDSPNLGSGAIVSSVSDGRASGAAGSVTVTLTTSIATATTDTIKSDVDVGTLVTIQRPRQYATVVRSDNAALAELRWFESTSSSTYQVLSSNIDSATRYPFVQTPADPSSTVFAAEPSINWQITYLNADSATYLPGSVPTYYKTNYSEGLIMPKSGNPLGTNSYAGITTSKSTTTTSTTSKSTTSTTSTSTTTSSVTTTSTTTTSKTTTSKSTSTKTTSTTSVSTTSKSTTSTTSLSTTSTTSLSTTSVSTTSKSTTSKSTTSKSTSTKTTSTTSKSTTTTSVPTTTSIATTSVTTTAPTTTITTTTTSVPTTSTTSTTSTTVPTTSIPLDG